jgi:hypothetical protein
VADAVTHVYLADLSKHSPTLSTRRLCTGRGRRGLHKKVFDQTVGAAGRTSSQAAQGARRARPGEELRVERNPEGSGSSNHTLPMREGLCDLSLQGLSEMCERRALCDRCWRASVRV